MRDDAGPRGQLRAGVAKVDVTSPDGGPAHGPLHVKALVLRDDATTVVLITVDAVAIGEIGWIGNDYLASVRARLQADFHVPPSHVLVTASHCHGRVCADLEQRTLQAVDAASRAMAPVTVGVGVGHEDRIMVNRRLRLRDGREADVRHAYALPPDDEVVAVGPVDPEIGVLRLDRTDGRPLAVVFHFACHPIQGVPGGANTADLSGFASSAIEDVLGDGSVALFVQGCAGDINPNRYKDVDQPRDAEPLGSLLGLSVLRAWRRIECRPEATLALRQETLALPRADLAAPIAKLQVERDRLVQSLQGTSLNLKSFLLLTLKYRLFPDYPSSEAHHYLHERMLGRGDLRALDATNRDQLRRYLENVHAMEELTRVQTNLVLLQKHQAANAAAGSRTVEAEVVGLRVGNFVLVTFPGELSVQIGLDVKRRSPHRYTFVSGYTNGYLYYTPTEEQLSNVGFAQEDSDCLVGPGWQAIFEEKVAALLAEL